MVGTVFAMKKKTEEHTPYTKVVDFRYIYCYISL